jgi:hypothetical protein
LDSLNFRLKPTSPLIDNGLFIPGISNDLDDEPWVSPMDIGCYEFK